MKKELRAFIEAELRDYHRTKTELEELRDNLLNQSPGPPDGMPRSGETSDPTYRGAARLMTNRRIRYMTGVFESISIVLDSLMPEKIKLIELRYWTKAQTLTDLGIAMQIGIDRSTLYRWIEDICEDIAIELGLMNPWEKRCDKHATL